MPAQPHTISVVFYHITPQFEIAFLPFSEAPLPGLDPLWQPTLNRIKKILDKFDSLQVYASSLPPSAEELKDKPYIVVLLTRMKPLADQKTLAKIILKFRHSPFFNIKEYILDNDREHNKPGYRSFVYQPIITISTEDIMTLFAEETHGLYKNHQYIYHLNLDSRIKFLDASIWHRYVPLYPNPAYYLHQAAEDNFNFERLLVNILNKMVYCHDNNIYHTNSAKSALEFQSRIMLNSFIAEVGPRGHHKQVTPFKFHSETQMAQMAGNVLRFFKTEHYEGSETLSKALKWRLLFVDDYAYDHLSTHNDEDENVRCRKSKRDIIQDLINGNASEKAQTQTKIELAFPDENRGLLNIGIQPPDNPKADTPKTNNNSNIIQTVCEMLEDTIYDVILIDYLLGESQHAANGREYGHDFLRALIDGSYLGKTYKFVRGPIGKFWVLPTSSFPHAFVDKIRQLGITSIGEHFYLSNGGDPVCTPELFRYNLYNFLKQQVEMCFATNESLGKYIGNFSNVTNKNFWTNAVTSGLEYYETRANILTGDEEKSSRLAKTIRKPVEEQNKFIAALEAFVGGPEHGAVENWGAGIRNEEDFTVVKKNWEQLSLQFPSFVTPLAEIYKKLVEFETDPHNTIRKDIRALTDPRNVNNFLPRSDISLLPSEIGDLKTLSRLDLSNNRLSTLPYSLLNLEELTLLYLSKNQFKLLPNFLLELPKLQSLHLDGNPILEDIRKDTALPDRLRNKSVFDREDLRQLGFFSQYWMRSKPFKIFLSYARPDVEYLEYIKKILIPYTEENRIEIITKDLPGYQALLDSPGAQGFDLALLLYSNKFLIYNGRERAFLSRALHFPGTRDKVCRILVEHPSETITSAQARAPFADLPSLNLDQPLDFSGYVTYKGKALLQEKLNARMHTLLHTSSAPARFPQGFALLVGTGVNDEDLPQTRNDITFFYSKLRVSGYDDQHMIKLVGEEATRDNILLKFDEIRQRMEAAQKRDHHIKQNFVFFFSGHGGRPVGAYDYHLLTRDSMPLTKQDLNSKLAQIPSFSKLILLDCCYAAGMHGKEGMRSVLGFSFDTANGFTLERKEQDLHLFSAGPEKPAYNDPAGEHGRFTKLLLEAWDSVAETSERILSSHISSYIEDKSRESQQDVEEQIPYVFRSEESFPIGINVNFSK